MPAAPRISFSLPVRNGAAAIGSTLESIVAQDFDAWELVISDNASTDATRSICETFAAREPRIRYHPNDRDIGQIENFNRALELARAPCLRWIGVQDTLAPSYAGKCVAALEAAPKAVGVTTLWEFVDEQGKSHGATLRGPRLAEPDPPRRLARFLWLMDADRTLFDPIYSLLRCDALARTRRLRIEQDTDMLLALELALLGPFVHVDECLAWRSLPPPEDDEVRQRRYHQTLGRPDFEVTRRYWLFAQVVGESGLSPAHKLVGIALVVGYRLRELRHLMQRVLRGSKRRLRRILGQGPPSHGG